MKLIGFFFGAGSSILYAHLGVSILFWNSFFALDREVAYATIAGIGFLYVFLQGFQVVMMRMTGIAGGGTDILMSLLPLGALLIAGGVHFNDVVAGKWNGDWIEIGLYTAPIIIDLTIFLLLSLIKFRLTSDMNIDQR